MAEWVGKDGRKHKAPLTEDGQRIKTESKSYYIKFRDENDLWQVENTDTPEIDVARQILRAREKRVSEIKSGILDPAVERVERSARQPIVEHVSDYEAYLGDANRSDYHIEVTIRHIREAIEFLNLTKVNEMTPERAMSFVGWLQNEPLEGKRRFHGHANRSPRTVNSYIVSLKSFYRWLVTTGRMGSNPIVNLQKLPESNDRRHERRAMTSEEFARLFKAACNDTGKVQGIDGPTRATIYLTAALTGLRRKELASLTRTDFRLDNLTPTVRIQGAYSKNKKTDEIPLHPVVVDRLRAYFDRTRPEEGQPVFPLRSPGGHLRATSKMMKHDCEAAGVEYEGHEGFADFHANRVLFITSLCRSQIGLATAQKLARHSDPKLTSNVYAKVSTEERAEAINAIDFDKGHQEGTTRGTTETAFDGKMGPFVARVKNLKNAEEAENDSCNPLKSNVLAQKKPLADTNGFRVDEGIRTPDFWNHNPVL